MVCNYSVYVLLIIEWLMDDLGWILVDLNWVVVVNGLGLYIGIWIVIMMVKVLVMMLGIDLVVELSLKVLVINVFFDDKCLIVFFFDVWCGNVFVGGY